MMKILHGSNHIIETPDIAVGNPYNDYGRGFYCTESEELAKEWACSNNKNGFANKYELDTENLDILYLNSDNYNILNWLAILTKNRTYWENSTISEAAKKYIAENFMVNTEGYDVIIGYRADDSYFSFARDFVSGTISYSQLSEAMKLGELGEQVVLISKKAFENIKFIANSPADVQVYYTRKKERDRLARKKYRETKSMENLKDELFMIDIIREGMKQNDPRLR